jgi:hypothetical protein
MRDFTTANADPISSNARLHQRLHHCLPARMSKRNQLGIIERLRCQQPLAHFVFGCLCILKEFITTRISLSLRSQKLTEFALMQRIAID